MTILQTGIDNSALLSLFDFIRIVVYTPLFIFYFLEFEYHRKIGSKKKWESLFLFLFFLILANIVLLDNTFFTIIPIELSRHFLTVPSLLLFVYIIVFRKHHPIKAVYTGERKIYIEMEF